MKPLVSLEGITVLEGGRELFADTSWTLGVGEHWGLLGPNGSGKSVLAAALCGQLPLVRGAIRYHFLAPEEAQDARFGWFPGGSVTRVGGEDRRRLAERYSPYLQARWNSSESGTGDTVAALLTRHSVEALNPYQVLPPDRDQAAYQARLGKSIVLTGAMIPYAFGSSDGLFNLGSALALAQVLPAGVYVAMNGRCFTGERVRKNRATGVFEEGDADSPG